MPKGTLGLLMLMKAYSARLVVVLPLTGKGEGLVLPVTYGNN